MVRTTPLSSIVALLVLVTGCNHSSPHLKGQVFVVLQNRETLKLSLTDVFSVTNQTAVDIVKQLTGQRYRELIEVSSEAQRIDIDRNWTETALRAIGSLDADETKRAEAQIRPVCDELKRKQDDALNLAKIALSVRFTAVARATTDVDGNFSIDHPNPDGCLFAVTTRETGIKTEYFCWLIRPPKGSDHIVLTNKNMIDTTSPENFLTSNPEATPVDPELLRLPVMCKHNTPER